MIHTIAIDPGNTKSQILVWDGSKVCLKAHADNETLLAELNRIIPSVENPQICIEMVACYGMAVGREVFDTCVWIGRFFERCEQRGVRPNLVFRQEVKLHLCQSPRAKDGNVRQAIIDRFGGKDKAIGKKASQGPLYGVSSHAWAALGLALTFAERKPSA